MKSFCIIFVVLFQVVLGAAINERVVGGSFAKEGQFPYQASIRNHNTHICNGAIISEKTILTGQTCHEKVEGNNLTVVVGALKWSSAGIAYEISKFVPYPGYIEDDDIAIVIVKKPIIFNHLVQPVKVPSYRIEEGTTLVYSGWGMEYPPGPFPETLKFFSTKMLSEQECSKYNPEIKNQFCTFVKGSTLCSGDIGGPLVFNGEIHGISTFNDIRMCENIDAPDWFTKVYQYSEWISKNME